MVAGACTDTPAASGRAFPAGFAWGVATSAFQVEGGVDNDYTDWIAAGGAPPHRRACNSWELYETDARLAAGLGVQVYRLSVEWARLEPVRGEFDRAALARYRAMLQALRAAGLRPFVTLHHYTNPKWVAADGYWTRPGIVEDFRRYAAFVAAELGDLVDEWNPQNEPMVYATAFALLGGMPGGRANDDRALRRLLRNLAFAQAAAYDEIKAADTQDADGDGRAATVWAVQAASPFLPADGEKPEHVAAARRYDWFYNRLLVDALVHGTLDLSYDGDFDDAPDGLTEGVFPELKGRLDGIGVNYYNRSFVMPAPGIVPGVDAVPCLWPIPCGEKSGYEGDNRNEIWPPGLRDLLREFSAYGLPLLVTENGVADATDRIRPSFVVMHLMQLQQALAEGLDVRGYLHWSLLDNYEWRGGYDLRFGLYATDFDTFARTERPSAGVYRAIVTGNAVPDALVRAHDLPAINPLP